MDGPKVCRRCRRKLASESHDKTGFNENRGYPSKFPTGRIAEAVSQGIDCERSFRTTVVDNRVAQQK